MFRVEFGEHELLAAPRNTRFEEELLADYGEKFVFQKVSKTIFMNGVE